MALTGRSGTGMMVMAYQSSTLTNYGWEHYYEYMTLYNFNLYGDPCLTLKAVSSGILGRSQEKAHIVKLSPIGANPLCDETRIAFTLSERSLVSVNIWDVTGRLFRRLKQEICEPGKYAVSWDGKTSNGHGVSPGIYFVVIEAGGDKASTKIVLLR